MKNNLIIFFAIISLTTVAGCQRIEINTPEIDLPASMVCATLEAVSTKVSSQDQLSISAGASQMLAAFADSLHLTMTESVWSVQTKGTIETSATFSDVYSTVGFGVYAEKSGVADKILFNNETFTLSGSYWRPGKDTEWPDYATDFYAWAPKEIAVFSASDKTFAYTVPAVNTEQTDILVAKAQAGASFKGAIPIKFSHALTAVRFKTSETMPSGTLTYMKIKNVNLCGTYNIQEGSWSDLSNKSDITLGDISKVISDETPVGTAITGDDETFFVIPQTCGSDAALELVFNGGTKTISLSGVTFDPGTVVTFSLGKEPEYILDVLGEVRMDYTATAGTNTYVVTSNMPWKLQYTLDGGDNWTDAVAGTSINDWISFDKVSGGASASPVTVTATVTAASGETEEITIDHNKNLREASPCGTQSEPWDLSKHDIHGNPNTGDKVSTANCYVISAPGWYAFPLVYGNAINEFKVSGYNTEAYNPIGTAGTNFLKPFKKADGNGITSPFVEGATAAYPLWEDVPDFALIPENGCVILSQSEAAGKGLTGCNCGYVMFEVKKDALTQGNAVIAVSNGTDILWSWHIWVTDEDLTPIAVTNHQNATLHMSSYNLGWVDANTTTTFTGYPAKNLLIRFIQINGGVFKKEAHKIAKRLDHSTAAFVSVSGSSPYWQWGRKDPFIRADWSSTAMQQKELSSYSGSFIDISKQVEYDSGFDIAYSIKNPVVFVRCKSSTLTQWYIEGNPTCVYYNLWSATNNNVGTSSIGYSTMPVKTVYDPCPPGYQIPSGDAFTGFTSTGGNTTTAGQINKSGFWSRGFNFYANSSKNSTVFFPADGQRYCEFGSLANVSFEGDLYTAVPFDNNSCIAFIFSSGEAFPVTKLHYCGAASIRPVQE